MPEKFRKIKSQMMKETWYLAVVVYYLHMEKGCRCVERLRAKLKLEEGEAPHTLGGAGEGGT
jgi:hypothetical protein